jgi:hypothetical protein
MSAAPVVSAPPLMDECFDRCLVNCVWAGGSESLCEGICQDFVCPSEVSSDQSDPDKAIKE